MRLPTASALAALAILLAFPALADQSVLVRNQSTTWVAVTPSDTIPLAPPTGASGGLPKAIFNGNGTTECNIAVKSAIAGSVAVTFNNVQPGEILPISPAYVMATGTTCVSISALY